MLMLMLFVPLILLRKVGPLGVVYAGLLLVGLFLFVAGMTAKGISVEDDLAKNVESFLDLLRAYTVAPILAFSVFLHDPPDTVWGANTFRILYAVLYRFGMSDTPPIELVREFVYVPDQTNVFTVYDVYLSDFSYVGALIPSFFVLGHWFLYRAAVERGRIWIFLCAASYYALMMQFFQDVYVSLISQWLQIIFWYWLLTSSTVMRNKERKVSPAATAA
jgi:oligosaccharide repeat unit polymerase